MLPSSVNVDVDSASGAKPSAGRWTLIGAVVLACAVSVGVPSSAQTAPGGWPQYGLNAGHSSYVADPAITASSASQIGINWMTNLYSGDLGSPVVAYNATLGVNVAYVGNERGDVFAVNASNGQVLWGTNLGINDEMRGAPAVAPNGDVWIATALNPTLYKLNGATGAVECSVKGPYVIDGAPMIATPPGGPLMVYFGTVDGPMNGPIYGIVESTCAQAFAFQKYNSTAGIWVTPAYAVTSKGVGVVFAGTSDPDETMYVFNALTGALSWKYSGMDAGQTGDYDVGSAATASAPGVNGFADGVVYWNSKYGIEYANDLKTGALLWQFNLCSATCVTRSGAALDGNDLVFGGFRGIYALNATTGAKLWQYPTPAEALSSPAIIGPAGSEIVTFGDVSGAFRILALSNGAQLYTHQTGGFITSSPAEFNGNILIASDDGFLYSFANGGSNAPPPATSVASPANSSTVTNPNGNVTISGSSTDATGVTSVSVAIQSNGSSGMWYNGATGTYVSSPVRNQATLASPGATSTTWSYSLPAPAGGGSFEVFANTTNSAHIIDKGSTSSFTLLASGSEPHLTVTVPYAPPGGGFEVSGHSYTPGEKVAISLFGTVVATVTTQAGTGYVPTTRIPVPAWSIFGPTSITATGLTSGKTSSITVDITQEWTQFGYSAARSSFEPEDEIIENNVHVGKNSVLAEDWYYSTGAPVNSSPAVVNGILYAGNDAGVMSAIVTQTGAPAWTYTIPSASEIRSSPAIDPSGDVIFGANDGNLYTLSSTGTLVRTVALGGDISSPALANGQIYVAGGSTLYDLPDGSGAIEWKQQLGGTVAPPAYDSTKSIVIVGDGSGAITAFSSTSGAQLWKMTTGGAVTATAVIQGGLAYIGSADSHLYALNESTGAVVWKYTTDSPVIASASASSTTENLLNVGDQKGTLYVLYQTTGGLDYQSAPGQFGSAIIGLSGVSGNAITETTNGLIGATRADGGVPEYVFDYQTGASLTTTAAIIDGAVYVSAADGGVYAFSSSGASQSTLSASRRPVVSITNAWTCTMQP